MSGFESFWKGRVYHLDRMSLRDLIRVYVQYPAILIYILLFIASVLLALLMGPQPMLDRAWSLGLISVVIVCVYPLVEYLLHRYLLHAKFLYRSPRTAALWKRIHYDHHQDPNDLRVLFGALHTTLPTVAVITLPIGTLLGGATGASGAFATGLVTLMVYEFCHCLQHLRYMPQSRFLQRVKRHHLLHHFHNEQGNFGITSTFLDRLAGTYYGHAGDKPSSDTVYNLGYTAVESTRYPWVAELSGSSSLPTCDPSRP